MCFPTGTTEGSKALPQEKKLVDRSNSDLDKANPKYQRTGHYQIVRYQQKVVVLKIQQMLVCCNQFNYHWLKWYFFLGGMKLWSFFNIFRYLISFLSHNHQSWNLLMFFSTLGASQSLQTISVCSQVGQSSPKSEQKFFDPRRPDVKPNCHASLTSSPLHDFLHVKLFFTHDFTNERMANFFDELTLPKTLLGNG